MLAAENGEGWTLSDEGVLTVAGSVYSSSIESFEDAVKSIEVIGTGMFTLSQGTSFPGGTSGSITIAADGSLENHGTISGGTITVNGEMYNYGSISSGTFTVYGKMENTPPRRHQRRHVQNFG